MVGECGDWILWMEVSLYIIYIIFLFIYLFKYLYCVLINLMN